MSQWAVASPQALVVGVAVNAYTRRHYQSLATRPVREARLVAAASALGESPYAIQLATPDFGCTSATHVVASPLLTPGAVMAEPVTTATPSTVPIEAVRL